MGKLGIRRDDAVVVYDDVDQGIFSAPRVAWTLRAFGHDSVGVLNNFKLWCEQGYPTDSGIVEEVERVEYVLPEEEVGKREKQRVIAFEELKALVQKGGEDVQILDARSEGRWSGKDPEPRPGLSSGHIPYSKNLPFTELLDPRTKAIRPADDIRAILESKRVDMSKPVIASCGTGVTAAVIHAALLEAGYPEDMIRLYDGSWTEWAQRVTEAEGLIKKSDRE
jgi:thiosulfate/3-mercaptopyruvate sulfurtransferase